MTSLPLCGWAGGSDLLSLSATDTFLQDTVTLPRHAPPRLLQESLSLG